MIKKLFEYNANLGSNLDKITGQALVPTGSPKYKRVSNGKAQYRSIDFKGSEYLTLSANPDISTVDFSVEAWIYFKPNSLNQIIYDQRDADNDGFVLLLNSSNQIQCSINTVDVVSAIITEGWYYVIFTADRNGNGQIYLNNVTSGSAVDISSSGDINVAQLSKIGNRAYSDGEYLNGYLPYFCIYEGLLTTVDIQRRYEAFLTNLGAIPFKGYKEVAIVEAVAKKEKIRETGLVAAYTFKKGYTGDISGNGKDLTIVSNPIPILQGYRFDDVDDYMYADNDITSYPFTLRFRGKIKSYSVNDVFGSLCYDLSGSKVIAIYSNFTGALYAYRRNTTIIRNSLEFTLTESTIYNISVIFVSATHIIARINGIEVFSNSTLVSVSIDSNFNTFALGTLRKSSPGDFFNGEIYEAYSFNKTETLQEHKDWHNSFNYVLHSNVFSDPDGTTIPLDFNVGTGAYEVKSVAASEVDLSVGLDKFSKYYECLTAGTALYILQESDTEKDAEILYYNGSSWAKYEDTLTNLISSLAWMSISGSILTFNLGVGERIAKFLVKRNIRQ